MKIIFDSCVFSCHGLSRILESFNQQVTPFILRSKKKKKKCKPLFVAGVLFNKQRIAAWMIYSLASEVALSHKRAAEAFFCYIEINIKACNNQNHCKILERLVLTTRG